MFYSNVNEVVDRVTSNDSSSSDLIRLSFVCCRPALMSSTTSSVVFFRAWSLYPVVVSVYPAVVRQRLVRQLVRLSRCRCWDRRPSQLLSLLRSSSVSAAVAIETVVRLSCCRYWDRRPSSSTFVENTVRRGRRRSARLFEDVEPLHLRRRRLLHRSGIILSLVVHDTQRTYERCYRSSRAWAILH